MRDMKLSPGNLKALAAFAGVAAEFCGLIDGLRDDRPQDLYSRLEVALSHLQQPILHVQEERPRRKVPRDRFCMTHEQWQEIFDLLWKTVHPQVAALREWHWPSRTSEAAGKRGDRPKGLPDDYEEKWRRFKERMRHEGIGRDEADRAATLAGDLADIYRELHDGLMLWGMKRADAKVQAAWEWRTGYESHWGQHLFRAMLTVHEIRYLPGEEALSEAEP